MGLSCFKARTNNGGGSDTSTPLGLMTPTAISTTMTMAEALSAMSADGLAAPIANPSDAPATVIRANVPVSALHPVRIPLVNFRTVVNTAAKAASKGISAMDFDNKYSRLEYCCRSCSRWTTGFSFENKSTVFSRAIILIFIIPKVSMDTRSATDFGVNTPFLIDLKIVEKSIAFPADARSRIMLTLPLRAFCLQDRSNSLPNRRTA
mmetsp:Transcript_11579/g.27869  ORF Transcript_11579/g.27869 Transcript_11579/m.27869 type:complete len:207 (+) Transcript_11579:1300-1920(+)